MTIVGAERPTSGGREIVSVVLGADGTGWENRRRPIDPSEERWYVPGRGRRVFTAAGLTFGIATCHEGFRYPEMIRALVLGGARIIFAPHYVVTDDGTLPSRWCDASNPYNEKALMCRALENTVYVAASNVAAPDQGSIRRNRCPGRHARHEPPRMARSASSRPTSTSRSQTATSRSAGRQRGAPRSGQTDACA